MENTYSTPNKHLSDTIPATEREQRLMILYYDICDFLGLPTEQREEVNNSSRDFEYLLAISG